MKKIRFVLSMLAFVAAFSASIALKADQPVNQELWYIDATGARTDQIPSGQPNCQQSQLNCAQLFNVDNGVYTAVGNPIKGTRQN
jgi:hypothetical protein